MSIDQECRLDEICALNDEQEQELEKSFMNLNKCLFDQLKITNKEFVRQQRNDFE